MPLEDTEHIDIITRSEDGKVMLVITDAGITTNPDERFNMLIEKLKTYVAYVMSEDFKKEYSGLTLNDINILIMCKIPPTEQMRQITKVTPKGEPEKAISVIFQVFPGAG